ncbi:hypothetical protein GCM10008922_33300 [Faecalicatena contorta]|uniref:hypothetical protein n=1 Tax=Faecalicatena contorta TaxID=39482 RepID=UPI0031E1B294
MITSKEREYLRELAKRYSELAHADINEKKRKNWYAINDLSGAAKPVFINHYWPLALNEILPQNSYKCQDQTARQFESYLKTKMFYSKELEDDNVLEPVIYSQQVFGLEDYEGLERKIERTDNDTDESGAYAMVPVIVEDSDIEKLRMPKLTYDKETTRLNYEQAYDIFHPILTVLKKPHTMAAKIADEFSWFRGMENTYMDMYDEPEWMHAALRKITDNFKARFRMLEDAGIWGTLDNSEPLGSAGLRYATGIPDFRDVEDPFTHKVKLRDSWGFTCAEVFNCVSNAMHDEFSYAYDKEVMSLFKYINVGCCEVLDHKIDLIRGLNNARKISVSEWCDVEHAADAIKGDYVYSYRAAGVHFVNDRWDKENAEKEIRSVLTASKKHGCNTEIVLNIGGTLGRHPVEKVKEWSKMVRGLINEYY